MRVGAVSFSLAVALAGCSTRATSRITRDGTVNPDAWWREGVCYEVFVRSFYDSNGDGIGDLRGLTSRLDYINDGNPTSTASLGANCIWLMPIDKSMSYHGTMWSTITTSIRGTGLTMISGIWWLKRTGAGFTSSSISFPTTPAVKIPGFKPRYTIRAVHIAIGTVGRRPFRFRRDRGDRKRGTSHRCATSTTTEFSGTRCRISITALAQCAPKCKKF